MAWFREMLPQTVTTGSARLPRYWLSGSNPDVSEFDAVVALVPSFGACSNRCCFGAAEAGAPRSADWMNDIEGPAHNGTARTSGMVRSRYVSIERIRRSSLRRAGAMRSFVVSSAIGSRTPAGGWLVVLSNVAPRSSAATVVPRQRRLHPPGRAQASE